MIHVLYADRKSAQAQERLNLKDGINQLYMTLNTTETERSAVGRAELM